MKSEPTRVLNARSATIVFAAFFIGQLLFCALLDAGDTVIANLNGIHDSRQINHLSIATGKVADVLSPIIGVVIMIYLARILIPKQLGEASPTGAAWVLGKREHILKGLIIGATICMGSLILDEINQPRLPYNSMTPIQQLSAIPGWQQLIWILATVLIGPPVEEMMYRGILYGGYRKSFGPIWAAVFSTAIFVALHFAYFISFPYEIIAVTVSAIAFLWCRLRWNAIGPAIAAHAAFNFVIDLSVLWHNTRHTGF